MEIVTRMMDGSLPYKFEEGRAGLPTPGPPLRQDAKIEYLQRVPVFEGCSQRQLRALARITGVLDEPAGKVLTRAGEPGTEFFLIVDGSARAEVSPEKHVPLRPGDFFGEMSLLDGGPRSATVVAETPIRLLVIDRRNFWSLLTEVPRLAHTLLVTLSRRVRQAEQSLKG
ncbi:MAG: cyclic nucleotide-binding domain-containing protein [Candidatus Rokubacteria bacterium]|nr:cyclic nucleotide-binding domain-containing protein [Candidatus Rokubacteria bacterium]